MTNFEKIKNMSVNELASECSKGLTCAFCPIADFCEHTHIIRESVTFVNCTTIWKKWLKSEVKDNG